MNTRLTYTLLASSLILAACASSTPPALQASAELKPTLGNSVMGRLDFEQTGTMVTVRGEIRGLKANAVHGFHVHEKGDCSSSDGTSAGGHFNPDAKAHGQHGVGSHHVGDLPSLKSDAQGVARIQFNTDSLSLRAEDPRNIRGRSLIVHRDPDDYTSQPAGNSGPRWACGVIN